MSRQALATLYRPTTFHDVVEQSSQIKILEHQIKTGTFKNCYLFSGKSGSGKTTVARIFANEINNGIGDTINIDCAINNGVDAIEKIIEESKYKNMNGKYKVYIMDECHQLTPAAQSSLLLTLEEPTPLTIFILCTTDPQKLAPTILNRVQRFDFKAISHKGIVERLRYIINCEAYKISPEDYERDFPIIEVSDDVLDYLSKISEGGMRDAIAYLDKCLSYSHVLTMEKVTQALGLSSYESMFELVTCIEQKNPHEALNIIRNISTSGTDLKQFLKQFYLFLVDVNKYNLLKNIDETKIPTIYEDNISYDKELCLKLMKEFMEIYEKLKWESETKELLEAKVMVMCNE